MLSSNISPSSHIYSRPNSRYKTLSTSSPGACPNGDTALTIGYESGCNDSTTAKVDGEEEEEEEETQTESTPMLKQHSWDTTVLSNDDRVLGVHVPHLHGAGLSTESPGTALMTSNSSHSDCDLVIENYERVDLSLDQN